jgi:hypothetical protein
VSATSTTRPRFGRGSPSTDRAVTRALSATDRARMTSNAVATVAVLLFGWSVVSGALARRNVHWAARLRRRGVRAEQPRLGSRPDRGGDVFDPRHRRGDPGAAALLRRGPGQPARAATRCRDAGSTPRSRPPVVRGRWSAARFAPVRAAVGTRRVSGSCAGADGCRSERAGHQRRAHPDAASCSTGSPQDRVDGATSRSHARTPVQGPAPEGTGSCDVIGVPRVCAEGRRRRDATSTRPSSKWAVSP